MKSFNLTMTRLQKQQAKLLKDPIKNAVVRRKGIFQFHFCIYGLDGPYSGGFYHGVLILAQDYPFSPPKLRFFTPNGRFQTNKDICTTFTNFHKQSWSTAWNVETMVIATISFMQTNEHTAGGLNTSDYQKQKLAAKSLQFNLQNQQFTELFKIQEFKAQVQIIIPPKKQPNGDQSRRKPEQNQSSSLMIGLVILFVVYVIIKLL